MMNSGMKKVFLEILKLGMRTYKIMLSRGVTMRQEEKSPIRSRGTAALAIQASE